MVCELHWPWYGECGGSTPSPRYAHFVPREGVIMPTYEYQCQDCDQTFAIHQRLEERHSDHVECPECKGTNVEQRFAPFVAVTTKKS
jgi:putative FmdB family regulatory protein